MADGGGKDPLSMSLDDMIAKSSKRSDSTRSRSGRGGRGGSRNSGRRGPEGKPGDVKVIVTQRPTGRIQKPVGERRPLARARGGFTEPDEPSHIKSQKLDGDMRWGHDKAPRDAPAARRPFTLASQPAPAAAPRPVGSSQLMISNLDANVSDEDIKELFGSVGKLKTCAINYSREGQGYKSQGTANVEFISADLATAALQEFNGVHLDGKPMHIHQVMLDPDQLSSGVKISNRPAAAVASKVGNRAFSTALASAGRDSGNLRRKNGQFGVSAMDME